MTELAESSLRDMPYFMTNEEWYYHDKTDRIYKLTPLGLSIPEVVKSYEDFYREETDGDLVSVY